MIVQAGNKAAIVVSANKHRRTAMALDLTQSAGRIWERWRSGMTLRASPADMEYIRFVIVERCGVIDPRKLNEMKGLACAPRAILERKGEPQQTVQNPAWIFVGECITVDLSRADLRHFTVITVE